MQSLTNRLRNLAGATMALAAAFGVAMPAAQAEDWPTKPISIVVPFNAGGSADRMARSLAEQMGPRLGVPITVENRPGGAGALGATYFQQQAPDGQTFLVMQATPYLSSAIQVGGAPVKWEDFSLMNAQWNDFGIIAVHKDSPYTSLQALAEAMKEPGKLSSGIIVGNGGHIQTMVLMDELGVPADNIRFVTYSGGAPLRAALAGNQVDFEILAAEAASAISDRIRVLALVTYESKLGFDAPLLNDELAKMGHKSVPLMGGNVTGLIAHTAFKTEHPDRYQKVLKAYHDTLLSIEYQKWAAEAGIGADWIGPDKSQALVDEAYTALTKYADLLK